jgi:hypothetical protein
VVLHHPRQGGRRQSVGLTADATAQRPAAQPAHRQGGRARAGDAGHRRRQVLPDGVDRETRRHQRHHVPVPVPHRAGRPDRGAEGAGVGLGERLPGERGGDGALEGTPDLPGVRVGVPRAVRGEHGDEGDAGVLADLLDVGLQDGGRVAAGHGFEHERGIHQARDDRRRLLLGGLSNGLLSVAVRDERRGQDDGRDHHPLQKEQPHGETGLTPPTRRTRSCGHADKSPAWEHVRTRSCTQ